jgi:hypothetical protein
MLLSPKQFTDAWGADALVRLPYPGPQPIPDSGREFLTQAGLPALVRFTCGSTNAVITFCRLAHGLSPVLGEKTVGPALPQDWAAYWILGDEFFCNGSAWWCIDERTGRIDRIDVELAQPVEFANSSVAHFAWVAHAVLSWSNRLNRSGNEWSAKVDEIERELMVIDQACMGSRQNFWPVFFDCLRDEGAQAHTFERGSRPDGEQALQAGRW